MLDTFSRDFERTGKTPWRVFVHRKYKLKFAGGNDPEKWFDNISGTPEKVHSSVHAGVYKCKATFDEIEYGLYIKQSYCRSFKDKIKNLVRPGRSLRGFIGSMVLINNGFNAPKTIAIGEKRYGPILVKEFAVTLEEEAKDIYWWINERPKELSRFAWALGDIIGRMHKANICHGDLRPGNVLAKDFDNEYSFCFLDNERTVRVKPLPRELRKKKPCSDQHAVRFTSQSC